MPREFGKKKPSFGKFPKKKSYGPRKEEDNPRERKDSSERTSSFDKRDSPYPKKKTYSDREDSDSKSYEKKPYEKRADGEGRSSDDKPSFRKKPGGFKKRAFDKPFEKRGGGGFGSDDKPSFRKKTGTGTFKKREFDKPYEKKERSEFGGNDDRPSFKKKFSSYDKKPYRVKKNQTPFKEHVPNALGLIRLNRYIANAGICSRREADDLISSGVVKVNGKIITEMGYKVAPTDIVNYGGQSLRREKNVYVLLNKPKDYITTVDDPEKRRTVLELVADACTERIYPVGRLDRSTTGVLLLTNDGDLTKILTHPRYGIKKVYNVEIDKPIKHADFVKISEGIELEDGPIKVDKINYASPTDKKEIIIEIHSGKNRIVRRIFESLGYEIKRLDRVSFAGITKKELQRGRWRFLTEKEVGFLKMVQKAE